MPVGEEPAAKIDTVVANVTNHLQVKATDFFTVELDDRDVTKKSKLVKLKVIDINKTEMILETVEAPVKTYKFTKGARGIEIPPAKQ